MHAITTSNRTNLQIHFNLYLSLHIYIYVQYIFNMTNVSPIYWGYLLYIQYNQYILTSDHELLGLRYSPPGVTVQKQQPPKAFHFRIYPSLNSNFPLVWHDVSWFILIYIDFCWFSLFFIAFPIVSQHFHWFMLINDDLSWIMLIYGPRIKVGSKSMKIGAIWDVFWFQYGGVHAEHILVGSKSMKIGAIWDVFWPQYGGYTEAQS